MAEKNARKATNTSKPKESELGQQTYIDMDQVLATYADGFMVANAQHNFSIYFFEKQLPHSVKVKRRETVQLQTSTLKCVARIVIPQNMVDSLLDTIAENRGVVIDRKKGSVK